MKSNGTGAAKRRSRGLLTGESVMKFLRSPTSLITLIFSFNLVTAGFLVYWFEHVDGSKDQFVHWWDGVWWGITTITTTGYGDKFPVTLWGRVVAGLTMIIGIITMGIVTGSIASWLVERQLRLSRGLVNLSDKTGHLIICGWRQDMSIVLDEIIRLNPGLLLEDIAMVSPISQEALDTFKTIERFSGIRILRGDYFVQSMLERAGIRGAERVLILADASGAARSTTEVDAKTVMTAMTVDRIAPDVYVAAELLDTRFETYLRMAHVDEIIYSNEYARILLANSVKSAGLAHIVFDLLDVATDSRILTVPLPEELIGKTFSDVSAYCRSRHQAIAIGVVENTGKIREMKKEALRQAQKNPNTRTVLRNLKEVRNIGTNSPVLNPPKTYVVKHYSRAVIIAHAEEVRASETAAEVAHAAHG